MAFSYGKKNLANTTLVSSLSSSATSVTVTDASVFPGSYFYATLMPSSEISSLSNSEIVMVTNVSGNVLTIIRAQRGTDARSFNAGAVITNGIYSQDMDMAQAVGKKIFTANWDSVAGYYKIDDPMLKIVPDEGTSIRVVFDTDVSSEASAALSINENTESGTATKVGKNIEIRDANALAPVSVGLNGDTSQSISPDYTQVEWLGATGTQYIDTGVKTNSTMKVVANLTIVDTTGTQVFSEGSAGHYVNLGLMSHSGYYRGRCRNGAGTNMDIASTVACGDGVFHNFEVSQAGGFWIDGTKIGDFQSYTYTGSYNLFLYAMNSNGNPVSGTFCSGKIKRLKIYDNGTLVRDFIPAIRNSDSVAGMYDLANGTFYTNAGTGTFTTGDEGPQPNPDVPVPVQTVTGEQTIAISDGGSNSKELEVNLGKNLVDASQISQAATNVGITVDSDGLIKTSRPSDDYRSWDFANRNWEVTLPAGVYTFSLTFKEQCTMNIGGLFAIAEGASSGLFSALASAYMNKDSVVKTIYIDKTTTIGIEMKCGDGEAYLQVEKGATATTFAKYFTPIELCKLTDGNTVYQDYIYKNTSDNKWYKHNSVRHYVTPKCSTMDNDNQSYPGWTNQSVLTDDLGWGHNAPLVNIVPWVSDVSVSPWTPLNFGVNGRLFMINPPAYNLTQDQWKSTYPNLRFNVYYGILNQTDTEITHQPLIDQLDALASTTLYEGQNNITVSGDLAGYLNLTYNTMSSGVYVANMVNGAYILDNNTRKPAPAKAGLPYDLTYHSGNWYIMNMIGEVVLPDSCITTSKIANGAVTSDKMDWSTMLHFTTYVSEVTEVTIYSGGGILKYFSEFFGGSTTWHQMMNGKKIVSANVYVSGSGSTGDIRTKLMVASSDFNNWASYGVGINNVGSATRTVGCKVFLLLADV